MIKYCELLEIIMSDVIVDMSFGGVSVYPATIENANSLLETSLNNLDPQVLEIYNNKKPIINKENIIRIINKILSSDENEKVSKTIFSTKENKKEIVMYCFENKISLLNGIVNSYDFFKTFKLSDLSFFRDNENYNKDSLLVDEYILEQLSQYKTIKENRWKEDASEIGKIRYILSFAMGLSHRDVKYEVCSISNV